MKDRHMRTQMDQMMTEHNKKGYEHISTGMQGVLESIAKARQAQERWGKQYPEEMRLMQLKDAARDRKAQRIKLFSRGIPLGIVKEIENQADRHGNPLVEIGIDRKLVKHVADGKILIFISGELGTGKTLTICRWVASVPESHYLPVRAFCKLSDHYDPDRERIDFCLHQPIIGLDELGMEEERDKYKVEAFLHDRYENGLLTVCGTNLTAEELFHRYGARIESRVWDHGKVVRCTQVMREGEQRRKKC